MRWQNNYESESEMNMKAFKQICLMSIMLTGGGSALGMSYMNYLKPALCGGFLGGAALASTRYFMQPKTQGSATSVWQRVILGNNNTLPVKHPACLSELWHDASRCYDYWSFMWQRSLKVEVDNNKLNDNAYSLA
jgi:hypothetical protein